MTKLKMTVNPDNRKSHINKEIYGHFSEHLGRCIYNGFYVGEDSEISNKNGVRTDIIEALKEIKIPVLRWPGGCFADEYHWKDGIGEKSQRKKMINTNWGGVVEDNSFGTHEFMNMCEELGCEPYITGNVGSGTVQELSEWIEYMTFDGVSPMAELRRKNGREKPWKLKYLGIGNENWGCGGNMRPEYYADVYKRFQTFCKNYSGNELYKIACGPNASDYHWTDVLMANINSWQARAISLHYYTMPGDWNSKGSATDFTTEAYYRTIFRTRFIEDMIIRHAEIMSKHDRDHRIGIAVDEWGGWYDVEPGTNPGFLYQQNTMRDAIVAAVNLNIFNEHSDRVVMANIAQCVNVLQSVILTEGEKLVLTPTYFVFKLFRDHQDATLVDSYIEPYNIGNEGEKFQAVTKSVSVDQNGDMLITLANCSIDEDIDLDISTGSFTASDVSAQILTGEVHAHNTFDSPKNVEAVEYQGVKLDSNSVSVCLPKCSVVSIKLKKQ